MCCARLPTAVRATRTGVGSFLVCRLLQFLPLHATVTFCARYGRDWDASAKLHKSCRKKSCKFQQLPWKFHGSSMELLCNFRAIFLPLQPTAKGPLAKSPSARCERCAYPAVVTQLVSAFHRRGRCWRCCRQSEQQTSSEHWGRVCVPFLRRTLRSHAS